MGLNVTTGPVPFAIDVPLALYPAQSLAEPRPDHQRAPADPARAVLPLGAYSCVLLRSACLWRSPHGQSAAAGSCS
jgi:hypothetical protein